MIEKIVGDPVSSAMWACEAIGTPEEWSRIRVVFAECLKVGDRVFEDTPGVIKWVIETLEAQVEIKDLSPYKQARFTVRIYDGFENRSDGIFFANALNKKAVGGTFVYDATTKSINFVSYCGLALWWDLALLLYSARAACGNAEAIAHRRDMLRHNKCQPAVSSHKGVSEEENEIISQRLWDMSQPDYISGLWLSDVEYQSIISDLKELEPDFDITPIVGEESLGRNIEKMDFRFRAFPSDDLLYVFNGSTSICVVLFNEWTEWGRSLSVHMGVPFFTFEEQIPEGTSEETATSLANILNHASHEALWQKVGFGTWYAKGSQLCFSMVIPHSILKPIICGVDRENVAELFVDLIHPAWMNRIVSAAARVLHELAEVSKREPGQYDSVESIIESRKFPEAVRADNATISSLDEPNDLWTLPSTPFLVYGIFNPVGPTMGSLEIVNGRSESYIVNRWRHPFSPGEEVLFVFNKEEGMLSNMQRAVLELSDLISLPSFISIPQNFPPEFQEGIYSALISMAEVFERNCDDLLGEAIRMHYQPNPWIRPSAEESTDLEAPEDFEGMTNAEVYAAVSNNPCLVDFNIGLFQAWWEGAIACLADPKNPQRATETVEKFMQHTLDRMRTADQSE